MYQKNIGDRVRSRDELLVPLLNPLFFGWTISLNNFYAFTKSPHKPATALQKSRSCMPQVLIIADKPPHKSRRSYKRISGEVKKWPICVCSVFSALFICVSSKHLFTVICQHPTEFFPPLSCLAYKHSWHTKCTGHIYRKIIYHNLYWCQKLVRFSHSASRKVILHIFTSSYTVDFLTHVSDP